MTCMLTLLPREPQLWPLSALICLCPLAVHSTSPSTPEALDLHRMVCPYISIFRKGDLTFNSFEPSAAEIRSLGRTASLLVDRNQHPPIARHLCTTTRWSRLSNSARAPHMSSKVQENVSITRRDLPSVGRTPSSILVRSVQLVHLGSMWSMTWFLGCNVRWWRQENACCIS